MWCSTEQYTHSKVSDDLDLSQQVCHRFASHLFTCRIWGTDHRTTTSLITVSYKTSLAKGGRRWLRYCKKTILPVRMKIMHLLIALFKRYLASFLALFSAILILQHIFSRCTLSIAKNVSPLHNFPCLTLLLTAHYFLLHAIPRCIPFLVAYCTSSHTILQCTLILIVIYT